MQANDEEVFYKITPVEMKPKANWCSSIQLSSVSRHTKLVRNQPITVNANFLIQSVKSSYSPGFKRKQTTTKNPTHIEVESGC